MKRTTGTLILALAFVLFTPAMFAQTEEHGQVSVFADYTRLQNANDANFVGVGGRLGFNTGNHLVWEGEMAYDPERNVTTTFSNGFTTTFNTSRLRLLNGMFGPKIQTGIGPFRVFGTVKGGFLNFSVSRGSALGGFPTAVNSVTAGDTNGVFYPGGGIEFGWTHFGFRYDIGDEIYFDNGAQHNLKMTLGPTFRF